MIRLLAGLGLIAPVACGLVLLAMPDVLTSWVDDGVRSLLAAILAGILGVSLTALLVAAYLRLRIGRIARAVERIATGERDVLVPHGGWLDARLGRSISELAQQLSTTRVSATVDRLTGVANRQTLLGSLFNEVERANRYNRPLSVAFVDIDHFKQVNDTYGHAAGDVVLRGVAQAIQANLRQNDLIGRYGGEEFMLVLPETNIEDGAGMTEKLRHLVGRLRFDVDGTTNLSVTISIGVAGGLGRTLRTEALVRDADAAMYSAKALGRNQTYVFAEPDDDARVPRAPISPQGRARAQEIGRIARHAAEAALAAVVAPLPHHRGRPSPVIGSIVVAMASQLDLPDQEIEKIRIAALLHDLGKVAIPEEILEKPNALTSAEWRTVVQHPRIAQVILEQATLLREAVPIILHHHERYSGHGYPFGLRGNDIPLGARVVAIADAYDAMTHDRPYKPAISHEQAIRELRRHAGTQFDPELVSLFCDLYADAAPEADTVVGLLPGPVASAIEARATAKRPAAIPTAVAPTQPARRRRRRASAEPASAIDEAAAG
ncbi:MAG TPA: diguanylate cyclase [Candidatus Limnocylindrales bacterium]|nr:diguanylate cyclase [Candidatus Limnocylindrales bacterium]